MEYIEWARLISDKLIRMLGRESYEYTVMVRDNLVKLLSPNDTSNHSAEKAINLVLEDLEALRLIEFKDKGRSIRLGYRSEAYADNPQSIIKSIKGIALSSAQKAVLEYLVSLSSQPNNDAYPTIEWATWEMLQAHFSLSTLDMTNILEDLAGNQLIKIPPRMLNDEAPYPEARATYYGFIKCHQ